MTAANVKTVALVAVGVIVAGYVLYAARDIDFIQKSRNGFDTGIV